MRLIEKSGTLQILDTLRESSVKEDVSDLVDTEEEVLLGSEDIDAESVNIKDRKPIAGFYVGRGNSDPGIAIYEIRYGIDDEVLALDLAKGSDEAHWYKIENELVDEDGNDLEEPRAYIDVDGIKVYMDECMRTNLHEAEETVDVFVNPKRDYKITDVTMLEPTDAGDVRAIDMQSILIGLDESLTEKYGAKWGEFNIQSSRTPRGKISENDISYVLHVLNVNGHEEILNYNTKGIGRIREAFVTNSRGKVLSSKRCAISRIPKFFMEATEEFIDKYKDDAEEYEIEVWDTEEDRDQGYGYLLLDTYKTSDEAVEEARKVFNREGKACVEVLDPKGEAIFTIDDEGENFWKEDEVTVLPLRRNKVEESEEAGNNYVATLECNDCDNRFEEKFFEMDPERVEKFEEDFIAGSYDIRCPKCDSSNISLINFGALNESLKEDAVLPNNGYIDQTGLNLVSDERIQDNLRRRVQRLKARQKLLKAKKTFKNGNVAPVDEKNTHGKESDAGEIGKETEPITDTKIKESVVTLDTDNGTVDIDGNVSHVTLDQDGTMTAVSGGEIITTTDNSVEVLPSEETMIADDSVLEPVEGETGAEDIIEPEEQEQGEEVPEIDSSDDVVETDDIAMAEPVPASELEESAKVVKENVADNEKFWNSDVKIGDKFKNGDMNITVLELNKPKNYIIVNRGGEYEPIVAAWHPELSDNGELVWGQGHYFDNLDQASAYLQNLDESIKEAFDEKVESDIEGEETKAKVEEELAPSAIFHRRPNNVDEMRKEEQNKVVTAKSSYVVKDVKEVSEEEFDDICNNLGQTRDFLKEFSDNITPDNTVSFNCLEVKSPKGSLLIDPSGYGYARYCAFKDGVIEEPAQEETIETEEVVEEE